METNAYNMDRIQKQRISSLGRIFTGIILVLIFLAYTLPAESTRAAATFTVDMLGDWEDTAPGDGVCDGAFDSNTVYCTLRAAIQEANALSGTDTINFDTNQIPPGSTITLENPLPIISENLTIQGPGAAYLAVDGVQLYRIFDVNPLVNFNLSNITLTRGAADEGGAIYARHNNDVTIDGVRFIANTGNVNGGAIFADTGIMVVKNSLFEGNHSSQVGGAVYSYLSAFALENSTFANNNTQSAKCRALYAREGGLNRFHNVTMVNVYSGGTALCAESGSSLYYTNSILTGESASICDVNTVSISENYNILSDSTCDIAGDDQVVPYTSAFTQVVENVLRDNGGDTETYALLSDSRALDYGNPDACRDSSFTILSQDQRGDLRPFPYGGRCDIGAYEFSPPEYDGSEQTCGGECAVNSVGRVCSFCPPVTVTVPPNTLPDGSKITVMQLPTPGSGASFDIGDWIYDINVFGPDNRLIETFANPLKVCIIPTSEDLSKAAGNYDHIKMFHQHYGGPWTLLGNTFKENAYLCANVSQFSYFGIGVPGLPDTGFEPGTITTLPALPALSSEKAYSNYPSISIDIPALDVQLPIVGVPLTTDGWDVTWLGESAGYLQGTAFPTWTGNTAITGHVWDANNQPGPFYGLQGLRYGDQVVIHAWGLDHIYQVQKVMMVKPDTLWAVPHSDYDMLTLITCKDYDSERGAYNWRYAVQAVLVEVRE